MMFKKIKNFPQIIISLSLFSFNFCFAQERSLEVNYPEIYGLKPTTSTLLPDYVKYIFNFSIAVVGIIAFLVLIFLGFKYKSSMGNPKKLEDTKKRIIQVFVGIILLLSSYIILKTINPEIVTLRRTSPDEIIFNQIVSNTPSSETVFYSNVLWRITEIASSVKELIEGTNRIKESIDSINIATSNCDCSYTEPMCLVKENYFRGSGVCKAPYCYSGSPEQPCPNYSEIKIYQDFLSSNLNEIVYYRNRTEKEIDVFDLENYNLKKGKEYLEKEIEAVEKYKSEKGDPAGKETERIKELEKQKNNLEERYELSEKLKNKLIELKDEIDKLTPDLENFYKLPDKCWSDVYTKCVGHCKGSTRSLDEGEGGGHDYFQCAPLKCDGGNPCPMEGSDGILTLYDDINSEGNTIIEIANEIISIVEEIIKL